MMWAIDTPVGKRLAYWVDEGTRDSVFGGGLMGIFRGIGFAGRGIGHGFRYGATISEPLRTSLVKRF